MEITQEMTKLRKMKQGIESRLKELEMTLRKAKQRTVVDRMVEDNTEELSDEDAEVMVESDLPVLDSMDISNMLEESVHEDQVEKESKELLLDIEEDLEDEDVLEIESLDDEDYEEVKLKINEDVRPSVKLEQVEDDLMDPSSLSMAPGWRVRQGRTRETFCYTSPGGSNFVNLVAVLEFMEKQGCKEEDMVIMRSNLR